MKIVTCLGNPGRKYEKNRHNAGFIIGNLLAEKYKISINQKQFSSVYGRGRIGGFDTLIIFPQTFMNNSGKAVRAAMDYFKETPENLLVIHDEIELGFGEINIKYGGGHKGHNGIRSIGQHAGTLDFARLRIGVGRQANPGMAVADYLLSDFTGEELEGLIELFPLADEKVISLLCD